jgi:hypothetical protein
MLCAMAKDVAQAVEALKEMVDGRDADELILLRRVSREDDCAKPCQSIDNPNWHNGPQSSR